ncbi:MAG TPA: class I SAM-dependent methyltransferase, partial [Nakamurella sp.]
MTATVDTPATQHGATATTTTNAPAVGPREPDPALIEQAVGKVFTDLGVFLSAPMLAIGDRLGLFRAMAGAGPLTSAGLAQRAGLVERYVREWVRAVAIGGYVDYHFDQDAAADTYALSPEMAMVLADDDSPVALIGVVPSMADIWAHLPAVADFFRAGGGQGWGDLGPGMAAAQARFTRPQFVHGLVGEWIPAIDGMTDRLQSGAKVADLGVGLGVSTVLAAQAWPASRFVGSDPDGESVVTARRGAVTGGVADRAQFVVADAAQHPGSGYDLVLALDCLHDMGDPIAALRRVREILAPDGVLLVAEPLAADRFADDFANPYARIGYAISTLA